MEYIFYAVVAASLYGIGYCNGELVANRRHIKTLDEILAILRRRSTP